ncbi:hypothetical protein GGF32_009521 [Allomyces javanicus]|nr:hypothetical protein GGF32_009521 [Allomyces javanicus]
MPALPRSAMPPPTATGTARTATADTPSPVRATRFLARRAPHADGDGALRITDSPGSFIEPHGSVQVAKTGVAPNDNNASSSSTSSDTSAVAVGSVVIYVLGALIAFVVLVYVLYWLLAFPLPWIRRWYQRHKSRRQLCRALSHSDKFPVFRFDPLAVRPRTTARSGGGGGDTAPTSTAAGTATRANSPCASLTATDAFVPVPVELSPVIATRRIDDDLMPVVRGAARDDETGAFVAVPLDEGTPVTAPAADDDQTPLALTGTLAMTPPLPPVPPAAAYAPMCTSPDVDSTDAEVAHHAVLVEYAATASDATSSCAGSSSRMSSTASSSPSSSCSSSMCSSSRPVSAQRDASIVAVPLDQDDASPRTATDADEQDGLVSTTSLTCSICLEDYALNEAIRELPCHHDFHAKCVQPWLERALTDRVIACPVCRASWPLSSLTQDLHRTPSTRARLRRWRHRTLSGLGTPVAAPTTVTPPRAHHRLRRAVTATIPTSTADHRHFALHRHGTTGAAGHARPAPDARRSAHPRTLSGWAAVWNRTRSRSGETTRDVVWSRSAATSPVPAAQYAPLAPTTVQPQTTVVFAEVLPAPEPAHLQGGAAGDE